MKKSVKRLLMLLLALLLVMSLPVVSFSYSQEYINIPDPNFAAAVRREMGLPEGAPIPRARAAEMTWVSLSGAGISNLAGIEYFTALQRLNVRGNQLPEIDLSNNPKLEWLDVAGNRLTEINVSNNLALSHLAVNGNQITELDVSRNHALENLAIYVNNLTEIDVSNNPGLRSLHAYRNQLTEIDVSNNPALRFLHVRNNNLTTLDVSNNPMLDSLYVSGNRMESLEDVIGWRDNEFLILGENFTFYPQQGVPEPPPSSWAVDYINRAVELCIVPWSLNSMFEQPITRAAFTTLVVRLYETVTERYIINWWNMEFSDTNNSDVRRAAYIGVVQGVGGGQFDPRGTLTREQAATMLARLAYAIGSPLPEYAATFSDNDAISSWAIDAVGQVQAAGIMSGVGNNMFDPQGTYTREQSIVTMLRLFDFVN